MLQLVLQFVLQLVRTCIATCIATCTTTCITTCITTCVTTCVTTWVTSRLGICHKSHEPGSCKTFLGNFFKIEREKSPSLCNLPIQAKFIVAFHKTIGVSFYLSRKLTNCSKYMGKNPPFPSLCQKCRDLRVYTRENLKNW